MDCRFDRNIIQKYIDNTIEPLEYIFLKEHLAYCSECKEELEVLSRIDEALYCVFEEIPCHMDMEAMIGKVVEDCLYESEKKKKLRFALKKAAEVSVNVVENTTRFTHYLPGNKLISAGSKKAAAAAGQLIKASFMREVRKLLTSE